MRPKRNINHLNTQHSQYQNQNIDKTSIYFEKYMCEKCHQNRINCPCKNLSYHLTKPSPGRIRKNSQEQSCFTGTFGPRGRTTSAPKITFTYAQGLKTQNRTRSNSISGPSHYVLTKITRDTYLPIPPRQDEQIIYYPVIHNKLVFFTPDTPKVQKNIGTSRKKRACRSYMNHIAKSPMITGDTRQPLTPQQFKKLSEWTLEEKQEK